jgi:hypothetical protein
MLRGIVSTLYGFDVAPRLPQNVRIVSMDAASDEKSFLKAVADDSLER